jgi:DNA-binding response OmpR family regulator
MKILLLEDDVILQEIIEEYLVEKGYKVESFFDGEKALDAIGEDKYDLLLLDVNVPNINGFEILSYLRDIGNTTPTVYITSLAGIEDLKKGFALGADDYLKKPFELEELDARISHIIKLYRLQDEIEFDRMRFIPKAHQIIIDGKVHEMRQKEAQVLEYFIKNSGKIISSDEIIENVWDDEHIPTHATIRTYIKNLRKLFGDKEYFDNIKGEGYRFNIV